jgi:hypothetical protein
MLLPSVFFCVMPADQTSRSSTQRTMTAADVMTGDATHDRTFDAALRVSSRGSYGQREHDDHPHHDFRHQSLPSLSG